MSNPSQTSQNSHPIYSTAGGDIAEHSSTSQLSSQKTRESTTEQPTYAAINENKKKFTKQKKKEDRKHNMLIDKGAPEIPSYPIEDMYAEVMKTLSYNPVTLDDVDSSPPIPPYKVEEKYTPVRKCSVTTNEEEAPPIPPYLMEDSY
jgi:hypothetical protein